MEVLNHPKQPEFEARHQVCTKDELYTLTSVQIVALIPQLSVTLL